MSKESKHDHKTTKCLKTIIFSLVMLAPFFAIGVKCWYVANNKNANESYRGSYSFDTTLNIADFDNNVTNLANYESNPYVNLPYKYNYNYNSPVLIDPSKVGNRLGFNIDINTLPSNIYDLLSNDAKTNGGGIQINKNNNNISFIILNSVNTSNFNIIQTISNYNEGSFYATPIDTTIYVANTNFGYDSILINTYIYDNTLSSVFYSSIQELDKASIFTWTTKTGTYTAVNNMCNVLGIVSPPLAVLITYWTLISIIYIIIDIVLETLIYLTHWINDKMI